MQTWEIRNFEKNNYSDVARIYQDGIDSRNATFQKEVPTFEAWDAKYLDACRFVVVEDGTVIGWSALLPFSGMPSYRGVAELSIYIDPSAAGKGIGSALMGHTITESEKAGFWTLQSLIFPENKASIALHKKFGFKTLCVHEKLGEMEGIFRDVALLERRSVIVGK
ncbi:GNAT family N-acetyltransferase [Listeria booriae]|uniref:GNAT family N-acetyltransferase n=1 Tax=Listeria booriae TaxID=1552123 RepID=UPI00162A6DC1|nr:GNAT family N-acetyltransferase [Listeria booriae]MBC1511808.1 N-acetyltransferase [Listeria booriae]MBC6150289.1 N-acetyltransferase [Listeria booriae]MBC6304854.1 N-acetyltransferase [Listeria booriae]